jgi:hypothetical protein
MYGRYSLRRKNAGPSPAGWIGSPNWFSRSVLNPPGRERLLTQAQLGVLRAEILSLGLRGIEVLAFQASRVAIDARPSDVTRLGRSDRPE